MQRTVSIFKPKKFVILLCNLSEFDSSLQFSFSKQVKENEDSLKIDGATRQKQFENHVYHPTKFALLVEWIRDVNFQTSFHKDFLGEEF